MRLPLSLCLIFMILALIKQPANAETNPRYEMRSVWLQSVWNGDWPKTKGTTASNATSQKAELTALLDSLVKANFNCASLQVRPASDALYKSSYEPWSEWLTGKRGSAPTYDPLEYFVTQCHNRGLEAHVWINPYRTRNGSTSFDTSAKSKGWVITHTTTNSEGKTTTSYILDPGNVDVQNHVVKVITEIVTNYDIDGVMFDDYFYPEGLPLGSGYDYNEWKASGTKLSQSDWRRDNCNTLIKKVAEAINSRKPYVRFGIGPAGVAGGNGKSSSKYDLPACYKGTDWVYDGIYCDPLAWLAQGSLDYISPQIYWAHTHSTNPYQPIAKWWSEVAVRFNRHFFASHSTSAVGTDEVAKQIDTNRAETLDGCPGSVMFNTSSTFINKSAAPIKKKFKYLATVPPMTWYDAPNPGTIKSLTRSSNKLSCTSLTGTRYIYYAIPTETARPAAMSDSGKGLKAKYIIGVTYTNSLTIPSGKRSGYWYAVAPLDRYGNEWTLCTLDEPASQTAPATSLIAPENGTEASEDIYFVFTKANVDSYTLQISSDYNFNRVDYESTEQPVSDQSGTMQYVLPASLLKNGTYYWRIITRKSGYLNSTSETRNFTVNSHYTGDGYVSIAESTSYPYRDPAKLGANYRLTNLWIRSGIHGNAIDFVAGDNHTRDFTVSGDGETIYIIKCQPGTAAAQLISYESETGRELKTVNLSMDDSYTTGLHGLANTLMTDDKGNICVTGMKLAGGKQISVGKIDPASGSVTTVVSIPESSKRIDHTALVGDVDGTFYLFAATSNDQTVYRWKVVNGKLSKTETMTISNPGYNPRVFALDESHIFIDGTASTIGYYTWGSGTPTGTFDSATSLKPTTTITDGGAYFTYDGMPMLVYATGNYTSGVRYRLTYGKSLPASYSGLTSLWEFPSHENGLGTSDPKNDRGVLVKTYGSTVMTRSASQPVFIYTFAPGNGLAAYRVDKASPTSIDDLEQSALTIGRNGNRIVFSRAVDTVEIHSVSGNLIARQDHCTEIDCPDIAGVYILSLTVDGVKQIVKINR